MKRNSIISTLCIFAILLSGCATGYREVSHSEAHATIKGEQGETIFDAKSLIYEINGLPIDMTWKGAVSKRRIPAGKNSVFVSTGVGQRLVATAFIVFMTREGRDYIVKAKSEGEFVAFMIVDETTNEVVAEKKGEKRPAPASASPMIIPIILPAG